MSLRESAFFFECEGDELLGIVSEPEGQTSTVGVLILVGGPQYRVGSHRQFVLLARHLARQGIACMRFDFRGMGDSTGSSRNFEAVSHDIRAAIEAFCAQVPTVRHIALWGLCDGASAACFYASQDHRVAATMLLNPWVRTEAGAARTYLKHYYLRRVLDPGFWKKLIRGGVSLGKSMRGLLGAAKLAADGQRGDDDKLAPLPERMAAGLASSNAPCRIVLSGRDYVAREFESVVSAGHGWEKIDAAAEPWRLELADHTFSSASWRDAVAELTVDWVMSLDLRDGGKKR